MTGLIIIGYFLVGFVIAGIMWRCNVPKHGFWPKDTYSISEMVVIIMLLWPFACITFLAWACLQPLMKLFIRIFKKPDQ